VIVAFEPVDTESESEEATQGTETP
jgi:hypothetical protein